MLNLVGTYLVCGGSDAPAVHFLCPAEMADHYTRDQLAGDRPNSRRLVHRGSFGADALYALPAWSQACMVATAETYTGHDAATVRGMAAALALGRGAAPAAATAAPVAPGKAPGTSGGQPAKLRPVKPTRPPGGSMASLYDAIEREALDVHGRLAAGVAGAGR
jgi:hypothetical protein